MSLNPGKRVHLSFTKKKHETKYYISCNLVQKESTYKYLDVILSTGCSWNDHVDEVMVKAGKALYIQWNLKCPQPNLKETAYSTCVIPIVEYACAIWDLGKITLTNKLKKIQNRAARFVVKRYRWDDSCTQMKKRVEMGTTILRVWHNDFCYKIRDLHARTNMYANSFFC